MWLNPSSICGVSSHIFQESRKIIQSQVSIETTYAKVDEKFIKGNEQDCIDAALICPVNAIWIDDISN